MKASVFVSSLFLLVALVVSQVSDNVDRRIIYKRCDERWGTLDDIGTSTRMCEHGQLIIALSHIFAWLQIPCSASDAPCDPASFLQALNPLDVARFLEPIGGDWTLGQAYILSTGLSLTDKFENPEEREYKLLLETKNGFEAADAPVELTDENGEQITVVEAVNADGEVHQLKPSDVYRVIYIYKDI